MVPVIETERLLLRPWKAEDAPAMFAYARDPQVGPNAGWPPHTGVEESRRILEEWTQPDCPDWIWAVTEKGKDVPIGSLGLHPDARRPQVPNCRMLGYVLARPYWGRGYMTEAVLGAMAYAFGEAGQTLVSVGHYPWNDRSRRVIEKSGFRREGTLRRAALLFDGRVVDECFYSMTVEEWQARR